MGRVVCIHHNDLDGRASAAVVKKKHPEALCIETNYDRPFPIDQLQELDTVYMVDFTPDKLADFQRLLEKTDDVHWIDHHGRNIKKYPFYDRAVNGLRVEAKPSGAALTWTYLFGDDEPLPAAILHTSDYDCWIYDFGLVTKSFEAGMQTQDVNPESNIWKALLDDCATTRAAALSEVTKCGKIILEYRANQNKEIVKTCAFECELKGYKVIACNYPCVGSQLFNSIDKTKYDIMSVFRTNGHSIVVSLYDEHSKVDCGEIAQEFGGGGHKGAAGFECKDLPFTNIKPLKHHG